MIRWREPSALEAAGGGFGCAPDLPDMFAVDPRPEVEAARLEMLRTEAQADRLGTIEHPGRVPEGHPAYEAEGAAIAAHGAHFAAPREAEAGLWHRSP